MFHFDEDFNLMFNTKLCASLQLKWGLGWRWGNFLPPSLPLSLRLFLVVSFHSEFESWFCWNKIFQKCSARKVGSPFHEVQESPSLCELPHLGAGVLWLAKGPYFEISSISWLILGVHLLPLLRGTDGSTRVLWRRPGVLSYGTLTRKFKAQDTSMNSLETMLSEAPIILVPSNVTSFFPLTPFHSFTGPGPGPGELFLGQWLTNCQTEGDIFAPSSHLTWLWGMRAIRELALLKPPLEKALRKWWPQSCRSLAIEKWGFPAPGF